MGSELITWSVVFIHCGRGRAPRNPTSKVQLSESNTETRWKDLFDKFKRPENHFRDKDLKYFRQQLINSNDK